MLSLVIMMRHFHKCTGKPQDSVCIKINCSDGLSNIPQMSIIIWKLENRACIKMNCRIEQECKLPVLIQL